MRYLTRRLVEVGVATGILVILGAMAVFIFRNFWSFFALTDWQLGLLLFAFLLALAWSIRLINGEPHYHPDEVQKASKVRVAHVDLTTGAVVKSEELTLRQARKRFFGP